MENAIQTAPARPDVPPDLLQRVNDLYDAGLMVQAYEASRQAGPLVRWQSIPARILAARLARNIGAPRLGYALILRAYREEPANPEARYYLAGEILSRRGPFAGWE